MDPAFADEWWVQWYPSSSHLVVDTGSPSAECARRASCLRLPAAEAVRHLESRFGASGGSVTLIADLRDGALPALLRAVRCLFSFRDRVLLRLPPGATESGISAVANAGAVAARKWQPERRWCVTRRGSSCVQLQPDLMEEVFRRSDWLLKGPLIGPRLVSRQPIDERNPFAFYFGHLAGFADVKLTQLADRSKERTLFERGVDPIMDPEQQPPERANTFGAAAAASSEPQRVSASAECHWHSPRLSGSAYDIEAIEKYVQQVREAMRLRLSEGGYSESLSAVLEHDMLHQDTLNFMARACADVKCPEPLPPAPDHPSQAREIFICAKEVAIGHATVEGEHRWDNEEPMRRVKVADFYCDSVPVTNAKFAEFVRDGGYRRPELWSKSAWEYLQRHSLSLPWQWRADGGTLSIDIFNERHDLGSNLAVAEMPAQVMKVEADAFCTWLHTTGRRPGARLMEEPEYERLVDADFAQVCLSGCNDYKQLHYAPVGTYEDATSEGVHDLCGNGWEWTATPWDAHEGFRPRDIYPEFSADFFDGHHYVIRGASMTQHRVVCRRSFRNWCQDKYPYWVTHFRVVRSAGIADARL
eukprot:TRINITY_DN3407_c0_g1_i1.p1 TRINITY_DN3407_c0_g1~~TRINITY_DN3407_c0_g1_i1.p1  ORF type:complete len:603 (+),score=132.08 TRINITY_DN3407_c0_g1_i1:49-1809(+)